MMDGDRKWQAPVLGEDGEVQPEAPLPLTITGLVRDAAAKTVTGRGSRLFVNEQPSSGSDIPQAPPGVSVDKNTADIQRELGGLPIRAKPDAAAYGLMTGLFAPDQQMDYKRGDHPEYRDFGNFNYGAVGTALGLSPYELHSAAGAVQMLQQHWEPNYGIPYLTGNYGDNDQDYKMINQGIAYGRSHPPR